MDGLDELSTTGPTRVARLDEGEVTLERVEPGDLGLPVAQLGDLQGGDAEQNAAITRAILEGQAGAPRDIATLNAAGALWVAGIAPDLEAGLAAARESIDTGAARAKLEALVSETRRLS